MVPVSAPPVRSARAGRGAPWQVVLLSIWLGWVTNFMVRSALAPGMVGIRQDFGLDHAEGGLLATGFLLGYAVMVLPGGLLGDRVGRRPMVLGASLGWAAGAVLIGLAPSFTTLFLALLALGVVMGCFNANDRPIVSVVTPKDKLALGQGLTYTGLGLGSSLGVLLAGAMAAAWGWRSSYFVFAGLSLVATVALWRSVPALPTGRGASAASARHVLGSRDLWLIYLAGMPSVAGTWLLMTWAPTILLETGGLDLLTASLVAAGLGLPAVPALVGAGLLSDLLARRRLGRKSLIVVGHVLLGVSFAMLAVAVERRWPLPTVAGLMLLLSFAQWLPWAPTYALLADMAPPSVQGLTVGLGATIWVVGAMAAPWLAGAVRDAMGSFAAVFHSMAALAVVGGVLAAAVHPAFRAGPERRLGVP